MRRTKPHINDFNQWIDLQRRTSDDLNDYGEESPSGSWETVAGRWVAIDLKSSQAQWQTGNDIVDATHLVTCWFDETLAAATAQDYRVLWGSRILRVLTVEDLGNNRRVIAIVCKERLGAVS